MLRCERCVFFQVPATNPVLEGVADPPTALAEPGECRRRPPSPRFRESNEVGQLAEFPIVAPDWWCGEYLPGRNA
jgi:hypothetical protein